MSSTSHETAARNASLKERAAPPGARVRGGLSDSLAQLARQQGAALSRRLRFSLAQSVEYSKPNMFLVGMVALIGFPLYYVVWAEIFPQPYENLPLRLLGALLCLPLLFVDRLPSFLRRYLTVYWLFTLLYSLPFFFTFMLLKNDVSVVWGMSTMAAFFLLVLVVYDWLVITLMAVAGSALAWLFFYLSGGQLSHGFAPYLTQLPIYLFTLVAGSVFNYKAELVKQEKLQAMAAVGSTIAHELRTPLLGIRSGISGLRRYVPQLLKGYELALAHGLPVERIRTAHYRELAPVLARIEAETHYSNVVIDMLLLNASNTRIDTTDFGLVSIAECVDAALDRYPFKSPAERDRIHWSADQDFIFWGSDVLMVHVLFNLLKNALQSMAAAGKGSITIRVEGGDNGHRLHFRDTGLGIDAQALPRIFDRFYTSMTAGGGTGIGLAFCRMAMKSFDGSISCYSRLGDFTEFVLHFPGADSDGSD